MPRIRTIKPEFPQSESMGRISRDARLTFLMLFTIADDSGRLRGNSRMLASLLFPYDDDAGKMIDGWLSELEKECCIVRYKVHGDNYIEVCNWLIHQKIDKPSPSKIPSFESVREDSPNVREDSLLDQGSRIKDQGKDQGHSREDALESSFEKFWIAYPKKVGKGAAETAWKRAKINGKLSDVLIAIENQKSSDQWKKDNGQFIPNPSTWINQRRWEDGEHTSAGAPREWI
jgi:hypothetical protein